MIRKKIKMLIPDKLYLQYTFKKHMNRKLNLNNPITYNEKLQWLKIHDRNPLYTTLVDKYLVKNYVKDIIGEKYIIKTLGVWERFEDIKFESLPNSFVLKCTHDSGGYVICKDKKDFNIKSAKEKIDRCMKNNFYWTSREWPYKNVKPRIIAEEYIGKGHELPEDYKFFTFNGEIDSVMICKGREAGYPKFYFYDTDWNRLIYQYEEPEDMEISKPDNFDEMIRLVKKLAEGYIQMRVDLYNINGVIYFGEMTIYNQGGCDADITYETDLKWGKKTKL